MKRILLGLSLLSTPAVAQQATPAVAQQATQEDAVLALTRMLSDTTTREMWEATGRVAAVRQLNDAVTALKRAADEIADLKKQLVTKADPPPQ